MNASVPQVNPPATILLTGATGFVGSALHPLLIRAGYEVRCLTRDVDDAQARHSDWEWAKGDLRDFESLKAAMRGCEGAFYLVHGMEEGEGGFREREEEEARNFALASAESGLKRIVYLGGMEPEGEPSEHLASRLAVGEILRQGVTPALELRASMIIGPGSDSWLLVRDAVARLPVIALPAALRARTQPAGIDDVVLALREGLRVPMEGSAAYDLPGPETLTVPEILEKTADALGLKPPQIVSVPFLSPEAAIQGLRFATRAEWAVAKELIQGLTRDLLARDDSYWALIRLERRRDFAAAARKAIADEDPRDRGTLGEIVESAVDRLRGKETAENRLRRYLGFALATESALERIYPDRAEESPSSGAQEFFLIQSGLSLHRKDSLEIVLRERGGSPSKVLESVARMAGWASDAIQSADDPYDKTVQDLIRCAFSENFERAMFAALAAYAEATGNAEVASVARTFAEETRAQAESILPLIRDVASKPPLPTEIPIS
jgi:uncharacterized protein YbjT (DUF2867 family)